MEAMFQTKIQTRFGERSIGVYCMDITKIEKPVDILTISCFRNDYMPTRTSLIGALFRNLQINVEEEAQHPAIDFRDLGHVWLSQELDTKAPIKRLAALEMSTYSFSRKLSGKSQENVLLTLHTFFKMLEMAASGGVKMDTVVIPIIGTGNQRIDVDFIGIPLINECIQFLEQCDSAGEICIVDRSPKKAYRMARTLEESYRLKHLDIGEKKQKAPVEWTNCVETVSDVRKDVFLSYNQQDFNYMKKLCSFLENEGVSVWYAPRDIWGNDYATCIVETIRNVEYFVPLISRNSIHSRHVLNEIDLAFNALPTERNILPIMLDQTPMLPAFIYYLSRLQWYPANDYSIETSLQQFAVRLAKRVKTEDHGKK